MKVRLNFSLLFFLFFSCSFFAQKIEFKGKVKDKKTQQPLEFTNIIAIKSNSLTNEAFAVSNNDGEFTLSLSKNKNYTIDISFVGYKKLSFPFSPKENSFKVFELEEDPNNLDEVIVNLPVQIKEDTIIYNASKFSNGKERKLKSLLKKLPGVDVNDNGEIRVKGKKITKFLVEGKKFFAGGSKLGVENIPADAVENIEVIDNYNEVSFLSGINDSGDMAMNIALKEEKKKFVFGDIEGGKGNKDFYKTNTGLFYYSPTTNVNFIGNLNNIGDKTFTLRDYLNFEGDINSIFSDNFDWKGGLFKEFLSESDTQSLINRFAALNIAKNNSETLSISGFGIFSNNDRKSTENTENLYDLYLENVLKNETFSNKLALGKISIEYSPSFGENFFSHTQYKYSDITNISSLLTSVPGSKNYINTTKENIQIAFSQNLEWHKKISNKHTFSAVFNYSLDKSSPFTKWKASDSFFDRINFLIDDLNVDQKELRINQDFNDKKTYLFSEIKEFWKVNSFNHLYFSFGYIQQNESFLSKELQVLDSQEKFSFSSDEFGNSTKFKLSNFYGGIHYKFKTGIFTFKQGFYLHNYDWNVKNGKKLFRKNKSVLLPDFLMQVAFNKSSSFKANYKLKSNFSNAQNLSNKFFLQGYNSLFRGNPNLENQLSHQLNLNYSQFNFLKGSMLSLGLSHIKQEKGFASSAVFNGFNQFLSQELINNAYKSWILKGRYQKTIKNLKANIDLTYVNSVFKQGINNKYNLNKSNTYSYDVNIETLFKDLPKFTVGFEQNIRKYKASTSRTFSTYEPYLNIKHQFAENFNLELNYKYYLYDNSKKINDFNESFGIIRYQKDDKPFSFEIKVKNLLNTSIKQKNSFSNYVISDIESMVLPRVLLLGVSYKL